MMECNEMVILVDVECAFIFLKVNINNGFMSMDKSDASASNNSLFSLWFFAVMNFITRMPVALLTQILPFSGLLRGAARHCHRLQIYGEHFKGVSCACDTQIINAAQVLSMEKIYHSHNRNSSCTSQTNSSRINARNLILCYLEKCSRNFILKLKIPTLYICTSNNLNDIFIGIVL